MDSEEDSQFSSKAPYISMSVTDDLPLLNVTEDLMWGALPEEKSTKPIHRNDNTSFNSSLAQLLCQKSNQKSSQTYKTNDHGGGLLNLSDFTYQPKGNFLKFHLKICHFYKFFFSRNFR